MGITPRWWTIRILEIGHAPWPSHRSTFPPLHSWRSIDGFSLFGPLSLWVIYPYTIPNRPRNTWPQIMRQISVIAEYFETGIWQIMGLQLRVKSIWLLSGDGLQWPTKCSSRGENSGAIFVSANEGRSEGLQCRSWWRVSKQTRYHASSAHLGLDIDQTLEGGPSPTAPLLPEIDRKSVEAPKAR